MNSGTWAQLATPAGLKALSESHFGPPDGDVTAVKSVGQLAQLAYEYARPERLSEPGALKLFKIPKDGREAEEALGRLRNEISVLQKGKPGLVKLIEASEREGWLRSSCREGLSPELR